MNDQIKVGIIGVSADRGWATVAHIPAIKSLPGFKLTAISNRHADQAIAAGKAHDVQHTYHTTHELVNSPDVDLVVVTVKVPEHKTVVEAAINAGKNIYCEWPLGNGLAEAEELAQQAREKGIYGVVGLQSRAVPAINFIKDLVNEGYVGEVLSTTLVGSGIYYGAFTDQTTAYAMDAKNGAGMIYSTFGNSIDALCYCLGEFQELSATAINRRKVTTVAETGEEVPMTAFDQVAVSGVLESGAVATAHFRGGMFKGTNFFWEINGTKGDLVITADGGHPGVFELTIKGGQDSALAVIPVPEKYFNVNMEPKQGPAYNIAENYARLGSDLLAGTHLSATFEDALIRHRMINAIEVAAATGKRQTYLK
ncbi:Gfo/Idh/MocA family oxidoreductase [Mucilaginibacter sp. SMC90]|uniref:Gfo/Idh/MocA family protein n=1 Tax=Mucilaginibacter sp. SMC90 TaxID=2929803 RepID=UPI001FB37152|nr:Gfo/Idh/MocA family oxidoreductase [Mucilaginibacter sp. SMC90]UOE49221.1 Gfo/Idh/MocA family oxidoreductase [Mucilaginibacter sp. SMC90]